MSWFEGIRIEFGVPRASVTTSDRGEHLRQIAENPAFVEYLWRRCIEDRVNVADIAIFMHDFPSFSADIFLKRAFLFFALLDRIYGRAQALARQLPVAADYQLPKVLRAAGVLRYSETLAGTGDSCTAIEAGSREETEI